MKDKILSSAIIVTLSLLVIFMLMTIVNQALLTRELSEKVEVLSKSIKDTQAAASRLRASVDVLERKAGIRTDQ